MCSLQISLDDVDSTACATVRSLLALVHAAMPLLMLAVARVQAPVMFIKASELLFLLPPSPSPRLLFLLLPKKLLLLLLPLCFLVLVLMAAALMVLLVLLPLLLLLLRTGSGMREV